MWGLQEKRRERNSSCKQPLGREVCRKRTIIASNVDEGKLRNLQTRRELVSRVRTFSNIGSPFVFSGCHGAFEVHRFSVQNLLSWDNPDSWGHYT